MSFSWLLFEVMMDFAYTHSITLKSKEREDYKEGQRFEPFGLVGLGNDAYP